MVMERLEGEPLRARIARGPLPIDEVVEFGAQLADALEAAHAQGAVHRDIKPGNLFITKRGQLKVLDFGVAKLSESLRGDPAETTAASDRLTTLGTTLGTVAYMSPEQARGQDIDHRSDLFSAGIVLYEMATGRLPFPGATAAVIFEGLLTKPPVPPSRLAAGVPPEFDRIVLKALEKDRETRYQSANELRADLENRSGLFSNPRNEKIDPIYLPRPKRRWAAIIGAPIVMAAAVAGFFVYKTITTPALTGKDTVVLATVVNRTGDTMFDDTLGEALGVQLRQSPFLKVVPDQQVQATLRLMGKDPMTPITEAIGREVCQRAGAKALLGGSIASLGTAYLVTLNAQDCVSGGVLAEEQAQADSKESVLKTLGGIVAPFREHLGESLSSIQRYDAKIEEATTASLDALKAYSQGIRTRKATGDFDAVPFFRRALELDPDFALAYARLGTVYSNLRQHEEARKMTTRAFELRNKASEAERLYIEARYYTLVQPDVQKALESYRLTLATYPDDYTALSNSALLLKQRGELAEALTTLEHAVRVAPDQPIAWSNLGETYMQLERFEDARKAYESAVKIQDSSSARGGLFVIGIVTGDTALADTQVQAMRGRRDEVDFLRTRMGAAAYQGRMKDAALLATEWQGRMEQASRGPLAGEGQLSEAINEALVGLVDEARARVADAQDDELLAESTLDEQLVLAAILVDGSDTRTLLPAALAAFKKDAGENPQRERAFRAVAALADNKPADAIALLEPVTLDLAHADEAMMWSLAQMRAGHWAEAARGFTWLQQRGRVNPNAFQAFTLVSLARAQAALGQAAEARTTYERFFEFWKDADADVPLLVQAKAEYAKIGARAP